MEETYTDVNVYWILRRTEKNKEKKDKAALWMQEWHVKWNDEADALAGAAAEVHAVPVEQANKI